MTTPQETQAVSNQQTTSPATPSKYEDLPLHPLVRAGRCRFPCVDFQLEVIKDSRDPRSALYCRIGSLKADPSVMVVVQALDDDRVFEHLRFWTAIPDQYESGGYNFKIVGASDVNVHHGDTDLNFDKVWAGEPGVYRSAGAAKRYGTSHNDYKESLRWIMSISIRYVRWLESRNLSPHVSHWCRYQEYLFARTYFDIDKNVGYVALAEEAVSFLNNEIATKYDCLENLKAWSDLRKKMERQLMDGLLEKMDGKHLPIYKIVK